MAGASDGRDDVIPAGDNAKTNQRPRLICTVDISNASGSHAVRAPSQTMSRDPMENGGRSEQGSEDEIEP